MKASFFLSYKPKVTRGTTPTIMYKQSKSPRKQTPIARATTSPGKATRPPPTKYAMPTLTQDHPGQHQRTLSPTNSSINEQRDMS